MPKIEIVTDIWASLERCFDLSRRRLSANTWNRFSGFIMPSTPHSSPPERHEARPGNLPIETASLILRAFVPEDAPKVFRMSQEEGMRTWLPSQVYRDEAHASSVLASLIAPSSVPADPRIAPYVLAVELRSGGALVGHVGFSPLGDSVEVGFAIESAHQRKGVATEAVRAACEWAVDAFSIATILGVAAVQNHASQVVLERAGFVRQEEVVMRFQGQEQPVIVFAFASRERPISASEA